MKLAAYTLFCRTVLEISERQLEALNRPSQCESRMLLGSLHARTSSKVHAVRLLRGPARECSGHSPASETRQAEFVSVGPGVPVNERFGC